MKVKKLSGLWVVTANGEQYAAKSCIGALRLAGYEQTVINYVKDSSK